jgi:hypothetical protein
MSQWNPYGAFFWLFWPSLRAEEPSGWEVRILQPANQAIGESTTTLTFPIGTLSFPDFTNITDEFSSQGVIFSADDSDLPSKFQKSLGAQENLILEGTFYNLFRADFISTSPVFSVIVILRDSNINPQTHTLTAFDVSGNVINSDSLTEDGLFPDTLILTISSASEISFIVEIEQQFCAEVLELLSYTTGAVNVSIDIKPSSDSNSINLGSEGVIPVAILTTSVADGDAIDFDATQVDASSLTLAGSAAREKGKSGNFGSFEDVDGDGDQDLVVQFPTTDLNLTEADTEAIVEGQTLDGTPIQGTDAINVIP